MKNGQFGEAPTMVVVSRLKVGRRSLGVVFTSFAVRNFS